MSRKSLSTAALPPKRLAQILDAQQRALGSGRPRAQNYVSIGRLALYSSDNSAFDGAASG